MVDVTQAVPMDFIIETILIIFAVVAIGIIGVKRGKKKEIGE